MTAAGQSRLTPRPRQPVPAQRSSTRGVSTPASIPAAASATTSVSARGQSTPGPTASSKSRKGQLPQRYCKGSRAARRRVSASSLAASSASSGRSVSRASRPVANRNSSRASKSASGQPAAVRRSSTSRTAARGSIPSLTMFRPPAFRAERASQRQWPPRSCCRRVQRRSAAAPRDRAGG